MNNKLVGMRGELLLRRRYGSGLWFQVRATIRASRKRYRTFKSASASWVFANGKSYHS
jgi:hypothetical protein